MSRQTLPASTEQVAKAWQHQIQKKTNQKHLNIERIWHHRI
jgi:hypothetical protein